jgi:hypothetical protein
MYSAFFGDKKSADHALTMLMLQASADLNIRNHITEQQDMAEGKKVDSFVNAVKKSEIKAGHAAKEAESIAWATANKRGMLNNKNTKKK